VSPRANGSTTGWRPSVLDKLVALVRGDDHYEDAARSLFPDKDPWITGLGRWAVVYRCVQYRIVRFETREAALLALKCTRFNGCGARCAPIGRSRNHFLVDLEQHLLHVA